MMKTHFQNFVFFLLLVLVPLVVGDCTCDLSDSDSDPKSATLKYRIGALFAILIGGTLGVTLPMLSRKIPSLSPENDIFFVIKSFAAGVILSTGFIHILPDAFDSLTSPCLKQKVWSVFPFAGFGAMVGAIGTLMVDTWATGYYKRRHYRAEEAGKVKGLDEENGAGHVHVHVHTHASHGHAHGPVVAVGDEVVEGEMSRLELIRHRVTSQVLELGIMVHSVIIGIALGASQSLSTIKPLMAALVFHQFFEGMGLGGCITQAKFESKAMAIMAFFFSLTTPLGVAIGIGISKVYSENSPTALIVQGSFDSIAAGILVYMALVDLLAADFMNPRMQASTRLQLGCNVSMLLGAACMSILAKWA
ncbi:Zinc transporter 1-like protein [Drosera capensis]